MVFYVEFGVCHHLQLILHLWFLASLFCSIEQTCIHQVIANVVPCQGNRDRIRLQQAAAQVLQIYLKFCIDIQSVLR